MNRSALAFTVVVALGLPSSVPAISWTLHVPLSHRTWTIPDGDIESRSTQTVASPLVTVRLGERHELIAQAGGQSTSLEVSDPSSSESSSLSGLMDTRLGLSSRFADGRLVFLAGLNLPTGLRDLDAGQLDAAVALAPPYLGYRNRQPGRGPDLGFGASYALPISGVGSLGIGAGYVHRGRFRAADGGPDMKPDAEATFSAGLDTRLSGVLVRLDVRRQSFFGNGGGDAFEEPPSTTLSGGAGAGGERWLWGAGLSFSRKEEAGELHLPFSGSYLSGGAAVHRVLGQRLRAGAAVEGVSFTGKSVDSGDEPSASAWGAGPVLRLALGPNSSVEVKSLLLFGEAGGESMDGWDVAVSVRISGGSR